MNILQKLGLDPENFDWTDLAACAGWDTSKFYEDYEADEVIAKNVDEACMSCPVVSACLKKGMLNKEYGVWGGVYLSTGRPDKVRNKHKTSAVWQKLRKLTGQEL